jgi:hypothetical protein
MILVVEPIPIDLTTYLQIAFLHHKNPSPHVYHISWSGIPVPSPPEKLYLVGHGGGQLGDWTANDLAQEVFDLKLAPGITKIILSGCHTGDSTAAQLAEADDGTFDLFCNVFADKFGLLAKVQLPIVAFSDTAVTFPDGRKRVPDPSKKSARDTVITAAFAGKDADKKKLQDEAKLKSPTNSADLIKTADDLARRYLNLVNDPAATWEKVWDTVLPEGQSKVYVNKAKSKPPKPFSTAKYFS